MGRLAKARVEITGDDTRFQAAVRRFQTGTAKMKGAAATTGRSFTALGAAGTAAFGGVAKSLASVAALMGGFSIGRSGVATIADFGAEMSKVKALTGATGEEFEALKAKARELGATTQFSASAASSGLSFLAQAGFNVNQILESSPAFLRLAASGGLDLARAMDIASNVMSGFGLAASDASRIADVLSQTAGSSNTNVEQLAPHPTRGPQAA